MLVPLVKLAMREHMSQRLIDDGEHRGLFGDVRTRARKIAKRIKPEVMSSQVAAANETVCRDERWRALNRVIAHFATDIKQTRIVLYERVWWLSGAYW